MRLMSIDPLTPLALIIVLIVSPFYYAVHYPLISAPLILAAAAFGVWMHKLAKARALGRAARARDEQKKLIKEAIAEERPRRFRNF